MRQTLSLAALLTCSALAGALAAYGLTTVRMTVTGLMEYVAIYPFAFVLLLLTPVAWLIFLPLPVLGTVVSFYAWLKPSGWSYALACVLAFLAAVLHGFWIEALMGI